MVVAAQIFWTVLGAYIALGAVASVFIHLRVLAKLDSAAEGGSWGFRVLVTPGLIGLWPVVLYKARKRTSERPALNHPDAPISSSTLRTIQFRLVQILAVAIPFIVAVALLARDGQRDALLPTPIEQTDSGDSN